MDIINRRKQKIRPEAVDHGQMGWRDWFEYLEQVYKGKIMQVIARPLHPDMTTMSGYTHTETWQLKEGDSDTEYYTAKVVYDMDYVVMFFHQKFEQLGLIAGASFVKSEMTHLIDMIQEEHSKGAERERAKAVKEAAIALVRAGLYVSIDDALQAIAEKSAPKEPANGSTTTTKSKAKAVQ